MKTVFYETKSGIQTSLHIVKTHFASRFAFAYAKEYCKGFGYDIGTGKREWCLPGAIPIDYMVPLTREEIIIINKRNSDEKQKENKKFYSANDLPNIDSGIDFIFSSHCLEHLASPYETIEYWFSKLRSNGILFLYLPHYRSYYWRPWNNKKHLHVLTRKIMKDLLTDLGFINIFVSGIDLNDSFMIIAEKK
jgi:SAM-dependent methyltransferase